MDWHGRESALAEPATLEREARYWKAFNTGDVDHTCVLSESLSVLIGDIAPAGEIVGRVVREADDLLGRALDAPSRLQK